MKCKRKNTASQACDNQGLRKDFQWMPNTFIFDNLV